MSNVGWLNMRDRGMKNGRNTKSHGRSLLGLPEKNEQNLYSQSEVLLEKDNDKKLEDLQRTVSKIKEVSKDIETGIQESNRLIDSLDNDMSGAQGLLKSAMNKLDSIARQGGNKHMCYLVAFVVFVFLILYFIMTRTTSTP